MSEPFVGIGFPRRRAHRFASFASLEDRLASHVSVARSVEEVGLCGPGPLYNQPRQTARTSACRGHFLREAFVWATYRHRPVCVALFLSACVICCLAGQARKTQQLIQIESGGSYTASVTSVVNNSKRGRRCWGAFEGSSSRIIEEVKLTKANRLVFIPFSVYSDLSNINHLRVSVTSRGCKVILEGGDAGTSFMAEVTVIGEKVSKRVVRDGAFPGSHYEETTYTNKRVID